MTEDRLAEIEAFLEAGYLAKTEKWANELRWLITELKAERKDHQITVESYQELGTKTHEEITHLQQELTKKTALNESSMNEVKRLRGALRLIQSGIGHRTYWDGEYTHRVTMFERDFKGYIESTLKGDQDE